MLALGSLEREPQLADSGYIALSTWGHKATWVGAHLLRSNTSGVECSDVGMMQTQCGMEGANKGDAEFENTTA